MIRRLLPGIGANLYGQAVTVAVQLLSLPGFLHAWGPARFGEWLLVSAATSVLSLADCGLMVASGNAVTMAIARRDTAGAGQIFGQTFRLVSIIALAVGLAASITSWMLPQATFGADPSQAEDARLAAIALCAAALASLPLGMLELGFRADGAYARGFTATSTVRLIETGVALAIASFGGGLAAAGLGLLLVRLTGTSVVGSMLRRQAAWVRTSARTGPNRLGPLLAPALAALAVPAGLALSLQGFTLAAGAVVSTTAVATLVAARTVTRVLVQTIVLVNHALMPEMAIAAGLRDHHRTTALLRFNLGLALVLLLPGWAVLVVIGPALTVQWTGGAVRPDPVFFSLMATAALIHGCWLSTSNLMLAVNRQSEYAYRFVVVAAGCCGLALYLGRTFGLDGLAVASLAGEGCMALAVLPGQVHAAFRRANPDVAGAAP